MIPPHPKRPNAETGSLKTLELHQRLAFLDLTGHLLQTEDKILGLVGDPGSGKTLLMTTIAAYLTKAPTKFRAVVIAVPSLAILEGFLNQGVVSFGSVHDVVDAAPENPGAVFTMPDVDLDDLVTTLVDGDDSEAEIAAHIAPGHSPRRPVLVVTIQMLAGVLKKLSEQGKLHDLSHVLFCGDEAHHLPRVTEKEQAPLWAWARATLEALGATSLLVSATLFRADGTEIIPEHIDGTPTKIHRFSKADLIDAGLSPSEISVEIRHLNVQLDGGRDERRSVTDRSRGAALDVSEDMIQKAVESWEQDGRPKAIFRTLRQEQAERVADALGDVRVARVWGSDAKAGREVQKVLRDRQRRDFDELEVDVVVGCRRVEEGFDWPPCTHVYNFGLIHSPVTLEQLHGRTRRKKRYEGYPHEHSQKSVLVQFIPKVSEEGARQMMADSATRDTLMLAAATLANVDAVNRFLSLNALVRAKLTKHVRGWPGRLRTSQLRIDADADVDNRLSRLALSVGDESDPQHTIKLWGAVKRDIQANKKWWTRAKRASAMASMAARMLPTEQEAMNDEAVEVRRRHIDGLLAKEIEEVLRTCGGLHNFDPDSLEIAKALARVVEKVVNEYSLISTYGNTQTHLATILNMDSCAIRQLQRAVDEASRFHPSSWIEAYTAYKQARRVARKRSPKTDMSEYLGRPAGTYFIRDFDEDLQRRRFTDQPEYIGSVADIVRETRQ